MLWPAAARDVSRRSDDGIMLRTAQRDRHHVLREVLAIAHAGIVAGADDVDETAFGNDVEVDQGMRIEKRPDHRGHHEIDGRRRRVDAEAARGDLAQAPDLIQGIADITQGRRHPRQQQLARLGQRDAAGGAIHQADAEALLKVA